MTTQPGQELVSLSAGAVMPIDNGGARAASVPIGFGTVTVNGVTPVTVVDAGVTAQSIILFTLKTVGGTVGAIPSVKTITLGTGFTVAGTASDTSTYNYARFG
jgi:hypothetical protein